MGANTAWQRPSRVVSAAGLVLAFGLLLALYCAGAPGAVALFFIGVPSAVGGLVNYLWESRRVAIRAAIATLGIVLVIMVAIAAWNRLPRAGSSSGGPAEAPAAFR